VRACRRSVVTPEERRQFVRDHRLAIFGYNRRKHGPAMTAVYYVMNGDNEILVSTMADRAKARAATENIMAAHPNLRGLFADNESSSRPLTKPAR